MGRGFGQYTLWLLFICSMHWTNVCFSQESLANVYMKECDGSANAFSHSGSHVARYESYRKLYTNCTYVRHNLEIVSLELTDDKYDMSFLENIREVNGYVLIKGNFISRMSLKNLRVIRGRTLLSASVNNSEQKGFGLYVAYNSLIGNDEVGLKELDLSSLVEILRGDVLFQANRRLCLGEDTINWNHIFNGRTATYFGPTDTIIIPGYEKIKCSETCHSNCTEYDGNRYCWGSGADMCQSVVKCANKLRCTETGHLCGSQCIAGCTTPEDNEYCLSCINFARGRTCLSNCSAPVYDPFTMKRIDPTSKYVYGSECVEKCPRNMFVQPGSILACVTNCAPGSVVNRTTNTRECSPCVGDCPMICQLTETILWFNNEDVTLYRTNAANKSPCKIVDGNLIINSNSFRGHSRTVAISLNDLEVLNDVEEITGSLEFLTEHENLTSLSFLRNLRVIHGQGTGDNVMSLKITDSSLESLDLSNLHKIMGRGVAIYDNPKLCYVYTIKWTALATNGTLTTYTEGNKPESDCELEGKVCSPLCSNNGCWGPEDINCITCRDFLLEGRCVSNCPNKTEYFVTTGPRQNLECRKCHEQCVGGCHGDGPGDCVECKAFRHYNDCVAECPSDFYSDVNQTCQPCNEACLGCTGNETILTGPLGCTKCRLKKLQFEDDGTRFCILNVSSCSPDYYKTYGERVDEESQDTCRRCHKECIGCEGEGDTKCLKCRNYQQNSSSEPMKCVSSCSSSFYDAGGNLCLPCNPQCKQCIGPSNYDCLECKQVRIYPPTFVGAADNETTYQFHCADRCPDDQPRSQKIVNITESVCGPNPQRSTWAPPEVVVPVIVLLLVAIAVFIIIFTIYWRKQKLRRLKESVLANDEIPMINSKGPPRLAILRLIKETELRKGNVIGSGAFGTVYKGIWIPEKENIKIPVAIKVLSDTSNTNLNVELLDEARIMASVSHPYCVRILAVCMTAQMMLITQLMPLGCLLDYVRKEKSNIGSRALLLWSVQIAKGMKYLEEQGIVHRDLAARNVLVHSPSQVKITDFGLAKLLDYEEAEIHSDGGKMPIKWLALECIQHRIYTHKSDVWSYGVTLWEMFTYGDRPYENLQARQIPNALEKGERLPQPSMCTIDVYMIMIKCWMLDVDGRPTFSDLATEFTRMAQDPGRFLVIPGDKLMRLPSNGPDPKDLVRLMSLPVDEPDLMVVSGDEYLRPMDLEFEGSGESFPASSSPLGPLTSIPENENYENTRFTNRINDMEDESELNSPSKTEKLYSQHSRENSQRYISDPCSKEQSTEGEKQGHVGQTIRVDKDGYLPPKSAITPPNYLDLVYQATDGNSSAPLSTQNRQQYLDMNVSEGLAKDNPEYYDDEGLCLARNDSNPNRTQPKTGLEKSDEKQSEYCNVPSNFGSYRRIPDSDI